MFITCRLTYLCTFSLHIQVRNVIAVLDRRWGPPVSLEGAVQRVGLSELLEVWKVPGLLVCLRGHWQAEMSCDSAFAYDTLY